MSRTAHNFWLDLTIFGLLLVTTITGFMLWLVVPHRLDTVFLWLSRSAWVNAHIWFGIAGLAGVLAHIVRHWAWLKALRGRPLRRLPRRVRANRVVDRIGWITFVGTNLFGAIAWALKSSDEAYVVRLSDRLHVVFGVAWALLMIVHVVLHWRWIASTSRRHARIGRARAGEDGRHGNTQDEARPRPLATQVSGIVAQPDPVSVRQDTWANRERLDRPT